MTGQPLLNSAKRRRELDQVPRPNLTWPRPSKKQKVVHPGRPPAAFWDNLSEKHLTRNALHELNRRNSETARTTRNFSQRGTRRPATRLYVAREDNPQRAVEFAARCTPRSLRDIKRSARHGGPDLSDLRGCRKPSIATERDMSSSKSSLGRRKRGPASSSKSKSTLNTATTKSTGPYDRAFQQHLIDFGIYPDGYEYPDGRVPPEPENMEELRSVLAKPRPSLSPSVSVEEDFRKFKRADAHASKERQVTTSVLPIIEGDIGDRRCAAGEIPFTSLDHLTDGSLVPGNPDLYYGARPEQLDRRARMELGGHIVPSTQHDLPIAPNFFLAAKGPDGSLAVAGRQATYDGALGARGIHSLRSHAREQPLFDNKAYTLTSIYHGGVLKMYTSHPIQPSSPGANPDFVTTQIKAYALTSDADTFRAGARAYRNGRDWARLQREEIIKQANKEVASVTSSLPQDGILASSFPRKVVSDEHASQHTRTSLIPSSRSSSHDPDTSADELSMDFQAAVNRSKRHKREGL